MQLRRTQSCIIASAVALFMAAGQRASADSTISIAFTGTVVPASVTFSINGKSEASIPGPYLYNETLPGGGTAPIQTFCMEIAQNVSSASQTYTVTSLTNSSSTIAANNGSSTQAVANAMEALYGFYYKSLSGLTGSQLINADSAFQLAIWELTYDGAADVANPKSSNFFGSGNFQSPSSTAEAEAQSWLSNVLNNVNQGITDFNSSFNNYTLVALTNSWYQDQLWLDPTPPPAVVGAPAPPGFVMAGLGLVALVGRSRLLRRNPAVA